MCSGAFSPMCSAVSAAVNSSIGDAVKDAAVGAFEAAITWIGKMLGEAVGYLLKAIAESWLMIPDPVLEEADGTVGQIHTVGPVFWLQENTRYLSAAIAVMAVVISAIRIVLQRDGQEVKAMARSFAWLGAITAGGVSVVTLMMLAGDQYSNWIIQQASGSDVNGRVGQLAGVMLITLIPGQPTIIVMPIVCGIVIVGALVQIMLAFGRTVGIVLLTGLLPLAGAIGLTSGGQAMRQRYITWLISLILYKPVAATIYAGVFWMLTSAKDLMSIMAGATGVLMALVALPALMRLIGPGVAMTGGAWSSEGGVGRASSVVSLANGSRTLMKKEKPSGAKATQSTSSPSVGGGGGGGGGTSGGGNGSGSGGGSGGGTPGGAATPGGGGTPAATGGPPAGGGGAPLGGGGTPAGGGGTPAGGRNPLFQGHLKANGWGKATSPTSTLSSVGVAGGKTPTKGMLAAGRKGAATGAAKGVASGAATKGLAATGGPWTAAAYVAVAAPAAATKKVIGTARSSLRGV